MARGTLDMWLAKHRADGKAALAAKPVPGRVCRPLKKLGLFPQRPIRPAGSRKSRRRAQRKTSSTNELVSA